MHEGCFLCTAWNYTWQFVSMHIVTGQRFVLATLCNSPKSLVSDVIRYGPAIITWNSSINKTFREERVDWLPQRNRQVQPHMRMQIHRVEKIIILYILVFIVWKPSVLHVVQCMLGHCFDKSESSTNIRIPGCSISNTDSRPDYVCIIRLVCPSYAISMDHGMSGKRQLDL